MVLIVLGGGALRFAGLGWGLRHPVHTDERVYVDNVVTMVEARDLDHRFYTYPALFYYILAPGIALLGHARRLGPDAYWISRGLVAFVGTGNILLAYVVASRLFGRAAGLATSLFLAVSPVDIRTSHQVRPDILLEGFGLAALLVFRNVGEDLRWDSRAGMLMGLATAIKFTGLLLLPFYLGARLLAPGPRLRGGARAALLAAALPVLLTPYAVLHYARYQKGPSEQLSMYYKEPGAEPRFWKNVAFYGEDGLHALGPLTALLVLGGLALGLARDPRGWAPRLLYPLTTLVVMSTPVLVFPRLILPAMGVIYALAGLPVEALARRHRTLAVLLALLAAAFPLRGSLRYVNLVARPSAADQALDWLVAHVPPGSRILETRPEGADPGREAGAMLGIDPARYEILYHPRGDDGQQALAEDVDVVVTGRRSDLEGLLKPLYKARALQPPSTWLPLGAPREEGPVVLEFQAPITRARYMDVDPHAIRLDASENASALGALRDGDVATSWTTGHPMRGGEWIEAAFPSPLPIRRLELTLGNRPARWGPSLRVEVSTDGRSFEPAPAIPARPDLPAQLKAQERGSPLPLSQVLLVPPRPVRALRILQTASRDEAWAVSELKLSTSP